MHKDIRQLMQRLGLKDREGRIYLTCLQHKDGLFIHEIAEATRITRSTVDLTVRRLAQRGFLNKVKVGRRLRYQADAPEALLFRQKQLVEDLEQAVPLLSKLGGQKEETEVIFFEGAEGYVRVHEDIMLNMAFVEGEKRELLSFASGVDAIKLFPNMNKQFIAKRIKKGFWYKGIAPQSSRSVPIWGSDAKALRAIKYLPDDITRFQVDMQIYADNVMLYSPTPPVGGVVIRNAKIAESMRSLFRLVWRLLPEG
ncbi:MAG: BlaI/MecI/CopY family transcriptional regulator [Alphaproteobacteria bacterium]|nr:BlaI/MecI/CopY family transcriptional regulator [Alphaproteobacteria bacterium]